MAIPVIDFSKLDGRERAKILAEIANGCEEWGFFQLVNHGIPEELLERVKKVSLEIYKLREAAFVESTPVQLLKRLISRTKGASTVEKLNVKWEDAFFLLDDNEWPSDPADFNETMKEYREERMKLGQRVMAAMEENLGLEKSSLNKTFTAGGENLLFFGTKVSHDPPCPRPSIVSSLRNHTDAGGVILLFQDDKPFHPQGWSVVDVQPLRNAIVINTGDQIEVLTNGRYKSILHRVVATVDGNRRSIATFLNPALKATIAPLMPKAAAAGDGASEPETVVYPKFVFAD